MASFKFHAVSFKDTVGKKRPLLLREIAKMWPSQKLCPFGRGLQRFWTITKPSHLVERARSHPSTQADVPVI